MALQPFRCTNEKCLADKGRSHIFHAEPAGTSDALKLKPDNGCPNCKSSNKVQRLVLIHFLTDTIDGKPVTQETATHKGTTQNFYSYACDRHLKAKQTPQATNVPEAVTCPNCLDWLKVNAVPVEDE